MRETEVVKIKGVEYTLYYFDFVMYHEDWHQAEEMGLVRIGYTDPEPDIWDGRQVFCKAEFKDIVEPWWDDDWRVYE